MNKTPWYACSWLYTGQFQRFQTKKVSGTVVDDKTPAGATVLAKGTTLAVKTDVNGKFTIEIPESVKALS